MDSTKKPGLAVGRSLEILARELRQETAPAALRAAEKAAQNAATVARSASVIARLTAGLSLEEALR